MRASTTPCTKCDRSAAGRTKLPKHRVAIERIDDANAGWRDRGLWTTTGTRTFYHNEGGKGSRPQAIKIQLRPDPLAR